MTAAVRVVRVAAPPADAWAALTEPGRLQEWLAERAVVELWPGGSFDLVGRALPESGGGQRVLAVELGSRVAVSWPLAGETTAVTLAILQDPGGCRVAVRHQAVGTWTADALGDVWTAYLGRLKYYIETGGVPGSLDLTGSPGTVEHTIDVPAPGSAAYAALTEPARMDEWLSENAQAELIEGGRYSYGWEMETAPDGYGPTTIVRIEHGRSITHGWKAHGLPTTVTWTVSGGDASARITITHSGFADGGEVPPHRYGWAAYMAVLAVYLVLRTPVAAWVIDPGDDDLYALDTAEKEED